MNRIKKAYQYLYYKSYQFAEWTPTPFWSEWKAVLFINILFIMLLLSLVCYYTIYIDRYLTVEVIQVWIIGLLLFVNFFNIYYFIYRGKWKSIVINFDKLPKNKNRLGSLILFIIVCLLFANLFNAFSLMSQIDWSQYR